jgi:hypothetical protein
VFYRSTPVSCEWNNSSFTPHFETQTVETPRPVGGNYGTLIHFESAARGAVRQAQVLGSPQVSKPPARSAGTMGP